MVFIVSYFGNGDNVETKSILVIYVFVISLLLQVNNTPFLTKKLNDLELSEILTCMFVTLSGMTSHLLSEETVIEIICLAIIVWLNFQFLYIFLKENFYFFIFYLMNKRYFRWIEKVINKDMFGKFIALSEINIFVFRI